MGLYFLRKGVDGQDGETIASLCPEIQVTIEYVDGEQQVLLNGENVSGLIRTEEVGVSQGRSYEPKNAGCL